MKKLEHKILPCVFCTIGLNCYIVGHNLVHATVQKLTSDTGSILTNQHCSQYSNTHTNISEKMTDRNTK